MDIITSASNKFVKSVRALRDKKGREQAGAFVVEGAKFVAEIPAGWKIRHIIAAASYPRRGELCSPVVVTDAIFTTLSDVATPQGILAVVEKKQYSIDRVLNGQTIFILENINDPGNLGTILRACHGLGACGVVLSPGCADIFSPKAVRASAGSLFHIPFAITCIKEAAAHLSAKQLPLYATSPQADKPLYNLNLQGPSAFLLGNEHHGLTPEACALATDSISIPTAAESLNVSMACAILAYEAMRQKNM